MRDDIESLIFSEDVKHPKRSYGGKSAELTAIQGARTWCGHGVFARSLVKVGAVAA